MLGYIISKNKDIDVIEHEIQSFDILRKTYLNIFVVENGQVLYKNDIINNASEYGHVQVLEWFKRSGYEFEYNELVIEWASYRGHIQVLEWFKHSGYEFKYNDWAIHYASKYGQVQVLEWFKHSGYKFKYDEDAINWTAENGHIEVLKWFEHSGYKLKYNKYAIIKAKNIFILKWFIKNINLKKVIKWSKHAYIETVKFKTKNKYFKGYKKN